jgi:hypothetical protein
MPITPDELAEERYTYVTFKGKETKVLKDNWLNAKVPNADLGESWTGKTVFKLSSKAIGRRLSGKTSTLPVTDKTVRFPEELSPEEVEQLEPNPAVSSGYGAAGSKLSAETPDLSSELQKLSTLQSMRSELFRKFVLEQIKHLDPTTNEPYNHDVWLQTPLCWICFHHIPRNTLYVPCWTDEFGPREGELGEERITLCINEKGEDSWITDTWNFEKEECVRNIGYTFTGATCFALKPFEHFPLAEPVGSDFKAQRPRQLSVPKEPTEQERQEHELTHLPFRSWCELCVKSKSKHSHSRTLTDRQPVVQVDYAFMTSENSPDVQVTILNAVDVLTGIGLSVVVPNKGKSLCDAQN